MKREYIDSLLNSRALRIREIDKDKIKSILGSAIINAEVAKEIKLNDRTATLIFREIYESIRQLGEAYWWILGYEPVGYGAHGVSLDSLQDLNIKEKTKLNFLDRFKQIRNDANYRGFRVSESQAKEIIEFWDKCGKEVSEILSKLVK